MSYLTQSAISQDNYMLNRVAAAVASEGAPGDPDQWASEYRRAWAAAPGWDAKWESALVTHEGESDYAPGKDEAVITDGDILSQVQALLTPEPESDSQSDPEPDSDE